MTENKDDKVHAQITRTVNLGKYESIKLEIGYTKTYTEDEDPMELLNEMVEELKTKVMREARKIKRKVERRNE
jgi:hypothetical protein